LFPSHPARQRHVILSTAKNPDLSCRRRNQFREPS
jgi:hypothetical protein